LPNSRHLSLHSFVTPPILNDSSPLRATQRIYPVTGSLFEKTVKVSAIKLDLNRNRQHTIEGTHRKRIRRSFCLARSASDSDPSGSRLEPDLIRPILIPDSLRNSLRRKTLPDIFNRTLDGTWNVYWFQGEPNFNMEMEMEDLLTRSMNIESDSWLAEVTGWSAGVDTPMTST